MNAPWVSNLTPVQKDTQPVFFQDSYIENEAFPSVKGPGLAFIALDEATGQAVRTALLPFYNHFRNIKIIDAGNAYELTNEQIHQICTGLRAEGMTPVLLGMQPELTAWLASREKWTVYQVSNKVRRIHSADHDISQSFIAYQRHFLSLEEVYEIEEHSFNSISLGKMRTFPTLLEPVVRDAQLLFIDLNALRTAEAPNIKDTLPTGLNAEELCQLAKYAGMADQLQCLGFHCAGPVETNSPEAAIIAESIWYFAEGLNMNTHDHPFVSKDLSEFIIYSESMEDDLEFVRHNQTLKWWLRATSDAEIKYLACSHEEYQAAIDNELPNRLARFLDAQE